MCSTSLCEISAEILIPVVSGLLLAALIFLAKERWFPLPKIAGMWKFVMTTEESKYKPFLGMELTYEAMLWNEGSRVYGTAEKVHENSSTGVRDYVGSNRTSALVEGAIQKNIFGPDLLILHLVEDGQERASTTIHELTYKKGFMFGRFKSMVAGQAGPVKWTR
jgi:hypothetical protein